MAFRVLAGLALICALAGIALFFPGAFSYAEGSDSGFESVFRSVSSR